MKSTNVEVIVGLRESISEEKKEWLRERY
jgi:hypothetical protein